MVHELVHNTSCMKASGKFEIAVTSQIWCASVLPPSLSLSLSLFLSLSLSLSLSLALLLFLSRSTRTTTSWHNRNFKVSLVLKSSRNFLSPILLLPFLSLFAIFSLSIFSLLRSSFHQNIFTRQMLEKKTPEGARALQGALTTKLLD